MKKGKIEEFQAVHELSEIPQKVALNDDDSESIQISQDDDSLEEVKLDYLQHQNKILNNASDPLATVDQRDNITLNQASMTAFDDSYLELDIDNYEGEGGQREEKI